MSPGAGFFPVSGSLGRGSHPVKDPPAELESRLPLQALLGYLNFSQGTPDPRFQKQLSEAYGLLAERGSPDPCPVLHDVLRRRLAQLRAERAAAFRDACQAEAVLGLVFDRLLPAYRRRHADLLFHQTDAELFQPFFVARAFEAVLAEGPPWQEEDRIIAGALKRLNDFVGYRPVAVLETRPRTEPYDHERVRPIPLFIRGAGVAAGRYAALVSQALEVIQTTPAALRADASFDLDALEELAVDPRAYDHGHPANKRPNYVFGEWDPHRIDNQGRYRRFVVRQVTLDALLDRVRHPEGLSAEEALFEAAAVLAGTILMASGVSGSGPDSHDSTTTLANLMPRIARYRDAFYAQLLDRAAPAYADRLRKEAALTRQPFGGARQHLNQYLARHRAMLLQQRHLALILADMGYPDASRRQASLIPAASVRFWSEIHIRLTTGQAAVERGDLAAATRLAAEAEDLIHRGIACGALPDPWNILGFQGQFPLFAGTQEAVHDQRIDQLVYGVEQLLGLYARLLSEAAARGEKDLAKAVRKDMKRLAAWWDRFASVEVSSVRPVHGGEAYASAKQVAKALGRWHEGGHAAADLAFWRQHLENFQSAKAFALVVDALLRKEDYRAAMGLLVHWLSQAGQVELEEGEYSFHALALRWMLGVCTRELGEPEGSAPDAAASAAEDESFGLRRRFLDYLEANAEEFGEVPDAEEVGRPEELPEPQEAEEDVYGAAYEGMTYQDSTGDRDEGEVLEGGPRDEFDLEAQGPYLLARLRYLSTLAKLWQLAGWRDPHVARLRPDFPARDEAVRSWLMQARKNRWALLALTDALYAHPIPEPTGDHDSLVEFDRRRHLKEQLVTAALAAAFDTTLAVGGLEGTGEPGEEAPGPDMPGWHAPARRLEQALFRGDAAGARAVLPEFVRQFRTEPLLYRPLFQGGRPRQILRASVAQSVLRALLGNLPRLGLLRETYDLARLAWQMEQMPRPGPPAAGRPVSVFDQLFQTAFAAVVETVIDAADAWGPEAADGQALGDLLDPVVEPFLRLWIEHGKRLHLSVLETIGDEAEWEALRDFIRRYGADLFHARFMTLGNLRGILHRGVGAYLDYLRDNPDPLHPVRLLDDLDRAIPRAAAERFLECVLAALVENYEEFKDYNTTTTQSDYGDNLHMLLDFLALKVSYDREGWQLRPLVWAHEVLVRKGKLSTAVLWEREFEELTRETADEHLADLADLERTHGMRLRTVADRLGERLVRPLALERLCALVGPAMDEAGRAETPAFSRFEQELAPYAAEPAGVGLDVPPWLRRLEAEVQRVRAAGSAVAGLAAPLARVPRVVLSWEDFRREVRDWDAPRSP
jgi:hypothetical protein